MSGFLPVIERINHVLSGIVWGFPMLCMLLGTGLLFTLRTGFFQLRYFGHMLRETVGLIFAKKSDVPKDGKAISQFQALSTALAATLGTGNIVGVAAAITAGGPGAVFWMWVSAFFGMMTSYAENVLGIFYRYKNEKNEWVGGAMIYLERGLGMKWLGVVFAVFCIGASFGMGNMSQVNSMTSAMYDTFSVPPRTTGIIAAAVAGLAIAGGIRRVGKITEKIVPALAIGYIAATLVILWIKRAVLPGVFGDIIREAFNMKSAAGGFMGSVMAKAVSMGFRRGVFSNEAGLGSSVIVHAASDVREPVTQGLWGMFEVLLDTIVMCTLTALVILSTGALETGKQGAALTIEAFRSGFGQYAGGFVSVSILLFAFSTILGWSYFGQCAAEYLFGTGAAVYYKIIFVAVIIFGATQSMELVWEISDTMNGLMAIPNLAGVICLSGTVMSITKNYGDRRLRKSNSSAKPMLSAYDIGAKRGI